MERNQTAYGEFADFYDQLMQDAPYDSWMKWMEEAVTRYDLMPRHVADLGCGTGTLSLRLFEKGYKVTGVDLSEAMLANAEAKVEQHSPRLQFLCQDLRELRLPSPCDLAVAFCDTLNYLTEEDDLRQALARIRRAVAPGGVFLFDVHTPYKLREKLGNQFFYSLGEEVSYLWQSKFDPECDEVEYDITFFALEDEDEELYRRFHETHLQRAYDRELLERLLLEAGFQTVEVYADFTWDVPTESSERWFFVAK